MCILLQAWAGLSTRLAAEWWHFGDLTERWMVASSQLTDVYIIQLDVMTGIDVCLTVSAEVRLWNSLETKWFCHSKSWSFRNRSEVADPRRFSRLSLCGCRMRTCLSMPVNLAWFRNAALTSEEIACLEKVTAQIRKVIIFWQKCDDLTCQHLSFACL